MGVKWLKGDGFQPHDWAPGRVEHNLVDNLMAASDTKAVQKPKSLKLSKAARKGLATPQPFLQPDARVVISIGQSPKDVIVSVKSRYGWLTVGLIEKLALSTITHKLQTDYVRPGCTLTDPFELKIETMPAPANLSPDDASYVEYTHNLIHGRPSEDDEDIKNEQAAKDDA